MTVPQLGAIGLTAVQERAYRYLVTAGGPRPASLVGRSAGLGPDATTEVLSALAEQGLLLRSGDLCRAAPPETALGTLVSKRGEELDRIKKLATELQEQYQRTPENRPAGDFLEVVYGREQVSAYYVHLVRSARSGLDTMTKPPYLDGPGVTPVLDEQDAGIRRGVRSRSLYDGDALHEDGTLDIARQSMRFGEQARVTGTLPFKLAIVDGHTGFLPLDVGSPAVGALLLRASPLLDGLVALFEAIWARAVPIRDDHPAGAADVLADRQAGVLRLMAAGLKDEAIARALNLSRRTVQKDVSAIMTALGARTRFQAALLAAERGWIV